MSKYLVVIIGHNYLHPLEVTGNIENIIYHLSNESNNNEYIYCIYVHNDKYDCYATYGVIYHGLFNDKEDSRVDGIRIQR